MTILDFESGKTIVGVLQRGSRGQTYKRILDKLSDQEIQDIRDALDRMIAGDKIFTAGWMPGNDWTGTPYQAIYEKPANRSQLTSGLMFGLLVWEAFERNEEDWYTGRFELNGVEIGSRTYWRNSP